MKSTLAVFAVLAIIGFGQTLTLPGKGPLRDDIQECLDLIPIKKISNIAVDYLAHDAEVQAAFKYLITTSVIKDFFVDFETILEVINLLNYLQREGVDIYAVINKINEALNIEKLVPPSVPYSAVLAKRTGGLKGLFKDIMKQFHYDDFITIYVRKMKTSPAFVEFVNQLKSDNFQQIVNKVFEIKSFQNILNGLKNSGVNLWIIADIMFIVLGIDVPIKRDYSYYSERTLNDELLDFWELMPKEKYIEIAATYFEKDQQVQEAVQFLYTFEFHAMVRAIEALKEHQALVMYVSTTGLNLVDYIQSFHEAIGMENYVPPKAVVENIFKSEIGVQKIGGGMKALLEDLYALLPLAEIDDLHRQKLRTSKTFFKFITMIRTVEMQRIVVALITHETYKDFKRKSEEKGLLLEDMVKLFFRMIGLKNDLL